MFPGMRCMSAAGQAHECTRFTCGSMRMPQPSPGQASRPVGRLPPWLRLRRPGLARQARGWMRGLVCGQSSRHPALAGGVPSSAQQGQGGRGRHGSRPHGPGMQVLAHPHTPNAGGCRAGVGQVRAPAQAGHAGFRANARARAPGAVSGGGGRPGRARACAGQACSGWKRDAAAWKQNSTPFMVASTSSVRPSPSRSSANTAAYAVSPTSTVSAQPGMRTRSSCPCHTPRMPALQACTHAGQGLPAQPDAVRACARARGAPRGQGMAALRPRGRQGARSAAVHSVLETHVTP
jgi:hypothetical protein